MRVHQLIHIHLEGYNHSKAAIDISLWGTTALVFGRKFCRARNMPNNRDDTWGEDIIAAPYIEAHYDSQCGIDTNSGKLKVPVGPGLGFIPDGGVFGKPVTSYV